jgi:hypothetical protein
MTLTQKKFFLATVMVASTLLVAVPLTPTARAQTIKSYADCETYMGHGEPNLTYCKRDLDKYGAGDYFLCTEGGDTNKRYGRVWANGAPKAKISCSNSFRQCRGEKCKPVPTGYAGDPKCQGPGCN